MNANWLNLTMAISFTLRSKAPDDHVALTIDQPGTRFLEHRTLRADIASHAAQNRW